MKFDDRRPERQKRGSTRNESCGMGGNESPSKPRLKKKEDSVPVRKPRLKPKNPAPPEKRENMEPGVKEPKPKGMSLNDPMKMLSEFNVLVNKMALAGINIVEESGGFSAVEKEQQELLKILKGMGDLPPGLSESFDRLDKAVKSRRYLKKVPVRNPKSGGRKFRYIYGTK